MLAKYIAAGLAASAGATLCFAQGSENPAAAAAAEEETEEMVNCVSLSRVDRTRPVDEQTILFYMNNGDVFRNVLPHRCPSLDENQTFMYRVTTTQLCNVDVITLLDDFGSRFLPGASCGLGKFQPISEAAAEEIIAAAERASEID